MHSEDMELLDMGCIDFTYTQNRYRKATDLDVGANN